MTGEEQKALFAEWEDDTHAARVRDYGEAGAATYRSCNMAEQGKGPHPHIDWRCADLRGVNMAGNSLRNADLRAANLSGCNFTGSDLAYADFRGANVQGAIFQNANLYGKMQGVEAAQADFRGADLRQANLAGAYLEGAMFPQPERQLWPSELAKSNRHKQAGQDQGKSNSKGKANGHDGGHSM